MRQVTVKPPNTKFTFRNNLKQQTYKSWENGYEQWGFFWSAGIIYSLNHICACEWRTCRLAVLDCHFRCMQKNTYKHATLPQHINTWQSTCKHTDSLWDFEQYVLKKRRHDSWMIFSPFRERTKIEGVNLFSHDWLIGMFCYVSVQIESKVQW